MKGVAMKPSNCTLIFLFSLLGLGVVQAQSGREPGSQVEVVLSGSGAQSATFTYSNGRVDLVTNRISVTLRLHPYSPQAEGNLYLSTLADFNGVVSVHSTATAIEGGSSDTQDFRNDATFTNYIAFSTQTEFFKADGTVASLSLPLLDPNTISPRQLEPYRLFYDGTNGVLTVWIRLPSSFIYLPYPSNDEAWQIPCTATVTGNGSSLKGLVQDASTGKPLAGATVMAGTHAFTSDADGSFLTPLLPPGHLTIRITDPGYGTYQATKILPPFSTVQQTFELTPARLVLVTHGWIPLNETFDNWPASMADGIARDLRLRFPDPSVTIVRADWLEDDMALPVDANALPDWTVIALDWHEKAHSLWPWTAEGNAKTLGREFGAIIQKAGFASCHLIGHSAGCWLVDGIADIVKDHDRKTGRHTDVHLTFLDAFAQGLFFHNSAKLGSAADWAEQYVTKGVFETDWMLPHAFNIDITHINPVPSDSHSWPHEWYANTVSSPVSPDCYGWGFQRSVEYAGKHPTFAHFPAGSGIDIQTGLPIARIGGGQPHAISLLSLGPGNAIVSDSGTVVFQGSNEVTMETGSPVFVDTYVPGIETNSLLRFDFEFLSGAAAELDVLCDGQAIFTAEQKYSLGVEDSGWQPLDQALSAGQHELRLLLTPQSASQSIVRISALQVGYGSDMAALPILSFASGHRALELSWFDGFPDYNLMSSATLAVGWTHVGTAPSADRGFLKVDLPIATHPQFFRLER